LAAVTTLVLKPRERLWLRGAPRLSIVASCPTLHTPAVRPSPLPDVSHLYFTFPLSLISSRIASLPDRLGPASGFALQVVWLFGIPLVYQLTFGIVFHKLLMAELRCIFSCVAFVTKLTDSCGRYCCNWMRGRDKTHMEPPSRRGRARQIASQPSRAGQSDLQLVALKQSPFSANSVAPADSSADFSEFTLDLDEAHNGMVPQLPSVDAPGPKYAI